MTTKCPCGSGKDFDTCCGPIIEGTSDAQTAEQLMRSRYTAFTLANADYLMRSWHPAKRNPRERKTISAWAKSVQWMGLKIVKTEQGQTTDTTGRVTFKALFIEEGHIEQIYEDSLFEKVNGRWVYTSGKQLK